jgi:hypothetical protein
MGNIYLIIQIDAEGNELFKIGISKNNPLLRVKSLSTGNPNQIRLLKHFKSDFYKKIERVLHKKYFSSRTLSDNEWFILTDDDVREFETNCQILHDRFEFLSGTNSFHSDKLHSRNL